MTEQAYTTTSLFEWPWSKEAGGVLLMPPLPHQYDEPVYPDGPYDGETWNNLVDLLTENCDQQTFIFYDVHAGWHKPESEIDDLNWWLLTNTVGSFTLSEDVGGFFYYFDIDHARTLYSSSVEDYSDLHMSKAYVIRFDLLSDAILFKLSPWFAEKKILPRYT